MRQEKQSRKTQNSVSQLLVPDQGTRTYNMDLEKTTAWQKFFNIHHNLCYHENIFL